MAEQEGKQESIPFDRPLESILRGEGKTDSIPFDQPLESILRGAEIHAVQLEALEDIKAVTSGSYNTAVELKNEISSLAIGLDDLRASVAAFKSSAAPQEQVSALEATVQRLVEDHGRVEASAQEHVTWQKKIAEEYKRFADFMEERLDMIVAVETAKSHESRISTLENQLAELAKRLTAKDSLAQAIWRNLIAIAASVVAAICLLKTLGWI